MTRGKQTIILAVLIALPFCARYQILLGMRQQIPLALFAHIQQGGVAGPGQPTLESNMGFTAQALGTRAAIDWFHGRVPLWNYYEGTGGPLAGEMQSAALFLPFILLLRFLSGQMFFHISLQIAAGICTFFYLRKIRLCVAASFFGAVLFELNGTFAWMANAAYNPIAFLPMALLGLELAIDAAEQGNRAGWMVLCAGAVWSVYAGFPEVAVVNAAWSLSTAGARASQMPPAALRRAWQSTDLVLAGDAFVDCAVNWPVCRFLSFSYRTGGQSPEARRSIRGLALPHLSCPTFMGPSLPWIPGIGANRRLSRLCHGGSRDRRHPLAMAQSYRPVLRRLGGDLSPQDLWRTAYHLRPAEDSGS